MGEGETISIHADFLDEYRVFYPTLPDTNAYPYGNPRTMYGPGNYPRQFTNKIKDSWIGQYNWWEKRPSKLVCWFGADWPMPDDKITSYSFHAVEADSSIWEEHSFYKVNEKGQILAIESYSDYSSLIEAHPNCRRFMYDEAGRLVRTDTHEIVYDSSGRVERVYQLEKNWEIRRLERVSYIVPLYSIR